MTYHKLISFTPTFKLQIFSETYVSPQKDTDENACKNLDILQETFVDDEVAVLAHLAASSVPPYQPPTYNTMNAASSAMQARKQQYTT